MHIMGNDFWGSGLAIQGVKPSQTWADAGLPCSPRTFFALPIIWERRFVVHGCECWKVAACFWPQKTEIWHAMSQKVGDQPNIKHWHTWIHGTGLLGCAGSYQSLVELDYESDIHLVTLQGLWNCPVLPQNVSSLLRMDIGMPFNKLTPRAQMNFLLMGEAFVKQLCKCGYCVVFFVSPWLRSIFST